MTTGGYIKVSRAVFEHPAFAREPFTEREAWIWLIAEAAWRERKASINGETVPLGRGEMIHSERWLARHWRWDKSKTRRFLKRLEREGMITVTAGKAGTVARVCNYDRYQGELPSEPPSEPPQPQKLDHVTACKQSEKGLRRTTPKRESEPPSEPELEDIKQEGKENMRNPTDGGNVIPLNAKAVQHGKALEMVNGLTVDDWFESKFWPAYPLKRGKKDARKAFDKAVAGGASPAEVVAGAVRYAAECRERQTPPDKIKYAQGWINGERWTDEPIVSSTAVHRPGDRPSLSRIALEQSAASNVRDRANDGGEW